MSRFRNQAAYSTAGGIATNASFVGAWFLIDDIDSIGVIVTIPTGAGSPTATFGLDVSNDPYADKKTDAQLVQPPTPITMTAAMIAVNPPGTDTAVNFLFDFDPCPRAKWARFKYTRTAGGSASLLQNISLELRGI